MEPPCLRVNWQPYYTYRDNHPVNSEIMQAIIIPVTPFVQNCSLLCCETTGKAAVVDPGGDIDRILHAAQQIGVTIEKILVTHEHIDHVGGVAELADRLPQTTGPFRPDCTNFVTFQ